MRARFHAYVSGTCSSASVDVSGGTLGRHAKGTYAPTRPFRYRSPHSRPHHLKRRSDVLLGDLCVRAFANPCPRILSTKNWEANLPPSAYQPCETDPGSGSTVARLARAEEGSIRWAQAQIRDLCVTKLSTSRQFPGEISCANLRSQRSTRTQHNPLAWHEDAPIAPS